MMTTECDQTWGNKRLIAGMKVPLIERRRQRRSVKRFPVQTAIQFDIHLLSHSSSQKVILDATAFPLTRLFSHRVKERKEISHISFLTSLMKRLGMKKWNWSFSFFSWRKKVNPLPGLIISRLLSFFWTLCSSWRHFHANPDEKRHKSFNAETRVTLESLLQNKSNSQQRKEEVFTHNDDKFESRW